MPCACRSDRSTNFKCRLQICSLCCINHLSGVHARRRYYHATFPMYKVKTECTESVPGFGFPQTAKQSPFGTTSSACDTLIKLHFLNVLTRARLPSPAAFRSRKLLDQASIFLQENYFISRGLSFSYILF